MNRWFRIAAFFLMTGVALGAFGAHALRGRLSPESLQIYQTGVLYQLIHGLGLFTVAWAASQNAGPGVHRAGWALSAGIVLFSGSLYLLAVTGERWLGAVTPLGGVAFLSGWAFLAFGRPGARA